MFQFVKDMIAKAFPELAGGIHLDRYARVLGMSDAPGEGATSERFRPRLAVDIQILTPDLEPDEGFPIYTAVPLPVPMGAGQECGAYAAPEAGAMVVVGFAYGRQDHPIIKQIYPLGTSLPQVAPGEFLLQKDPAVFQRADVNGNWTRATDAAIVDESIDRAVCAVSSTESLGSEKREISEHSTTEVGGNLTIEAGTVATVLAGLRVDVGSLGDVNLTAGANSTATTAGAATETVGGNHASTVLQNRVINISGSRAETIGQGLSVNVGQGYDLEIGSGHNMKVNNNSKEEIGGNKTVEAANIDFAAVGGVSITGQSGEISLLNELLNTLDEIKRALDVLATHNHPDAGTINQGGAVAGHANALAGYTGRIRQISR